MKKLSVALFVFLIIVFIFLVVASFAPKRAEAADNVKLIDKLEAIKTLQADFEQVNTIKEFGDDKYIGNVAIVMKDKALWDYTSPYVSWYLFTKNGAEQYDEVNNQLIRYKNQKADDSVILQILTDFTSAKANFTISESANKLKLTPKKDIGLSYLEITFSGGIIKSIKSEDGVGNITTITFGNIKIDKKVPSGIFKKELPKDAQIFEM